MMPDDAPELSGPVEPSRKLPGFSDPVIRQLIRDPEGIEPPLLVITNCACPFASHRALTESETGWRGVGVWLGVGVFDGVRVFVGVRVGVFVDVAVGVGAQLLTLACGWLEPGCPGR